MLTKKLLFISLIVALLAGCQYLPKRGATTDPATVSPTPYRPIDNSQNQFPSDGSSINFPSDGPRYPAGGTGGVIVSPPVSSQSTFWEARWDGTLNNRYGVEMRLRRDGPSLSGVVNYKTTDRRSYGVTGQIDAQNNFTLREASGAVWQGRLQGNDVIEGVRPNGPANSSTTPQWPFTLRRVENFAPGSLGSSRSPSAGGGVLQAPIIGGNGGGQTGLQRPSVTGPPVTAPVADTFDAFFPSFRTAVQRRDRAALQRFMAPVFAYGNELNVAPAIVFSELDLEGGMNWINLENAIAARIGPYQLPNSPNPGRIARYTPPDARYQVVVTFERDRGGQWRWNSMTYPGN